MHTNLTSLFFIYLVLEGRRIMQEKQVFQQIIRACLVIGEESIDLMILHYHWNKDSSPGICIVEDFTLILVCNDAHS